MRWERTKANLRPRQPLVEALPGSTPSRKGGNARAGPSGSMPPLGFGLIPSQGSCLAPVHRPGEIIEDRTVRAVVAVAPMGEGLQRPLHCLHLLDLLS